MSNTLKCITWFVRIITGGTFIFSGFVKAIDPWGTYYKLQDYMGAMHLPDYPNLLLTGAFLLFGYEFCVGLFLITGCFRKSAPICAAIFMGFMLPLTLWIAVCNPVADCGCFGDFLLISNWATFWKNVILSIAVGWLMYYNRYLQWLIRPHMQWITLIASAAYVTIIGLCGYIYQPLLDFRPYPQGSMLADSEDMAGEIEDDEAQNIQLIYERNGVEKSYGINDDLPSEEDGWTFVRREIPDEAAEAERAEDNSDSGDSQESTFRIWSDDGEDDVTADVMQTQGAQLILFMPELRDVSVASTWHINSLYTWAKEHDIDMISVVSGTHKEIADWRDLSLAAYPVYTADDTEIKMVVRGNPAVVYLKDSRIVWKTTLRALGTKDFLAPDASSDPASYGHNDRLLLYNISGIYLIILGALAVFSRISVIGRCFTRLSHDGREARLG